MIIRNAKAEDFELLHEIDQHISLENLEKSMEDGKILVAKKDGRLIGWLRWNLFWDNTPFMNLLYILEPWRGQGVGQALTEAWEEQMAGDGYSMVVTSTASNESAKHFYESQGYETIGGFTIPGEPYELMMAKTLR